MAIFAVGNGNLDETDLGNTTFAFVNLFPSNLTSGDWKVGIVVDEDATDGQAAALERILHGDEGGPFGEFAGLFGEWLGVQRASVTFSGGDTPSGAVGDRVKFAFEPLPSPDGGHTTVKGAMFGFAPEYRIGRAPGHSDLFGLDFDGVYGETADFEFSSEADETAPKGRV